MRALVLAALAGCSFSVSPVTPGGSDDQPAPDAPPSEIPPRLIPGGGIGDAPIDGLVNVYVIDGLTHAPISGAAVDVGTVSGATDGTGLFVARGDALAGKQTVLATQTGYRSALWVGVQGANVTIELRPAPMPAVPQANLSGTFPGYNSLAVTLPHYKLAFIAYSGSDTALDVENTLATAGNANICAQTQCNYTVTSRTGTVSLLGALYDVDSHSTSSTNDDTAKLVGYAVETGISVVDGVAQSNHTLQLLTMPMMTDGMVMLAPAPAGTGVIAQAGVEPSPAEILDMPGFVAAGPTKLPALTAVPGATYRLTAYVYDPNQEGVLAATLVRGITGTMLAAASYFQLPAAVSATVSSATWTPPDGATISGVVIRDASKQDVLAVDCFDGSTSVTFPARAALAPGTYAVTPTATRATFDVTNFGYVADEAKITGYANGHPQPVN